MGKRFGSSFRKRRLAAGLSQAEVGEKAGVSQVTVSNWETGKTAPSAVQRKALNSLLGASGTDDSVPTAEGVSIFASWLRQARAKAGLSIPELAAASGVSTVQVYNLEAGRSSNPREQTRARLERALNTQVPKDVSADAAIEQQIEGLGALTDFDPHDREDLPTSAGVYVFYDVSDRPIYVGKAANIKTRVLNHQDKFWFKYPIVSHAAYVAIADETLRHQVEQILIKFLKSNAVINIQSVERA